LGVRNLKEAHAVLEAKINKMMALGQYIHWADMHYEYRAKLEDDCSESVFIGVMSHWLAAQYVVIEGWKELKLKDKEIDNLLGSYPDYIDIFRRCRNAVYHYQSEVLDKRIQEAMKGEDLYNWLVALKWEFERFLCLYPFYEFGYGKDSIEFCELYFGCIGWKPKDNLKVKWFEVFSMCRNYFLDNELNELEINSENDLKMSETLKKLESIESNFLLTKLSRINSG
jgi:hypothetical protein